MANGWRLSLKKGVCYEKYQEHIPPEKRGFARTAHAQDSTNRGFYFRTDRRIIDADLFDRPLKSGIRSQTGVFADILRIFPNSRYLWNFSSTNISNSEFSSNG
jgi:hypothetical protein